MTPDEARQRAVDAAAKKVFVSTHGGEIKTCGNIISAFEAALWQPIETAPRDGTRFHAWIPPNGCMMTEGAVTDCSWHLGAWHHPYFIDPTHWRPLPAGPGGGA